MQEKLEIYTVGGKALLERDLSGDRRPLMIVGGHEVPSLAESVESGADVVGALVPDEDGWTLASCKPDTPVVSGPKTVPDMHLSAGVACSLGPWVFRIERDEVSAGDVLLWRVGSSSITADRLLQGKNVVAETEGGGYAVNPAVSGAELCEVFPTEDGVDVVAGGSSRLSVPYATLFAVGQFQAMALKAEDASRAVGSGSPFAWPARGVRQALMGGLIVVGAVVLAAAALVRERKAVEEDIAARHGAEMVEHGHRQAQTEEWSDEDIFIYRLTCLRIIPSILTADRSIVTADLIHRGEQLLGHGLATNDTAVVRGVKSLVRLLGDVDTIQGAVHKGDWTLLKETLSKSDREMFLTCDADKFYDDAKEIADFVTTELPKFLAASARLGAKDFAESRDRLKELFDSLTDNIFMSGDIVRRERDLARERWEILSAYVPLRDKFVSDANATGEGLAAVWADLVDVFDPSDASFAPIVARERGLIERTLVDRAAAADDSALVRILDIGEAVGIAEDKLVEWRVRATAARKAISDKYRRLYADYRLRAAVAPGAPETRAVLDEILALGIPENQFHKWAVREIESIGEEKKGRRKREEGRGKKEEGRRKR